ncbi:MAG: DNA gyrase subunit A [Sulfurimonas sp. RIFCSPHIGHO2_12_FULL_36_9]|jgi:DNA gyrase subunit A|uniref:DNA gyrase subunit A n=1 Tax=Sulfurimonas sp. RIFCSPLOWO2_12_36_12 TaxID=1802253 RepID=UPI0008C90ECF|nr:DNA gyrase subunit A [Sulfurimonas sp. RIFCSPLOWO2_12_36_12]OHD97715.1 MAG: DNA gyrase subunit A [Sulfurimonas sp. RIFCSPLOWO2_02_FULL_36_28]OHD97778.1 MAG: DNA gyrase subunit A [Sulfurimonas sp. RIFCSPHIGHO2_12_FULL_36_9]OHE01540.1 MAG: DNA gyrase subunit A [Sulfurimonas sp. RIFCSPLOWO2_12_36_12]OHE02839.1 MAG: DNA gyrase subunit A [Sulfurimonas sp. RIFCSPLOWO2_12_FULL_36_74]
MSNLLNNDNIQTINIEETLQNSYLDYSMSVIVGRALPDVRDGLKPVHRRILYAMDKLSLSHGSKFKKSARIVGDVIGQYHPHGDTAVYDALVRMAQHFSMRMELVDGQGNFGSVDGDSAAAMRYTEARMTKYAGELLKDLEKNTVNMIDNYDGTTKEPDVMPTRVPNLLINGSSGIAVGMATNIPPHNPQEVMMGLKALLANPDIELYEIMEHIKAPDFPTGGTIFGKKGIMDAYATGRGRIKVRAKTHIEKKGNRDVIVIDELPYQVNKARLIENIANLVKDKMIEGISEIRDESDRDGIRAVIELKKDAMSEIVLNNLFKHTSMQTTFGIIMLSILNQEPRVFGIIDILKHFINHRKTIIIRRTIFDLEKAKARAHILEGLKKALDIIDEIIRVIKSSKNIEEARDNLVSEFDFSTIQAQSIVDMRLGRLTGLEREKIENELLELIKLIEYLESILKSETILHGIIDQEFDEILATYTDVRRTEIEDDYDDIDIEDLIPNEPMVVTITHRGYIKRVPLVQYEKQKRGGKGKIAVTTYEDDFIERFFTCNTHDTLLFVTDRGQLHWLKVYKIPEGSRIAKGKAVVNLLNLVADEQIQSINPTTDFSEEKSLVFFTKKGVVKRTNLSEFANIRSNGVKAISLDDDDSIITAKIADQSIKYLFIMTKMAQCIKFDMEKTRDQGRNTRGVRGIKFKHADDVVVDADIIANDEQEILVVSEKGIGKRTDAGEYRLTNRGGSGVIAMKMTAKTGKFVVGCLMVDEEMDLMALTKAGKMIRVDMQTISKSSRNTSGVFIVKGDDVASVSRCPKQPLEDDEEDDSLLGTLELE